MRGDGGELEMVVLPIEGLGLWGTLYGFLALDADTTTTVRGITYYQHKEDAGPGRRGGQPALEGTLARAQRPSTTRARSASR